MTRNARETKAADLRENTPGSFIFELPGALSGEVCREMVRRFEACAPEQYAGRVGHHAALDTSVKRSTDLVMSGKSHWKDLDAALFQSLVSALDAMAGHHPFFGGRFKDIGYAVQRTVPGEFYHWHIDG
ncbi:MAG: 2OG-Fe(II) oxygenase, partial [Thiotrichales bacterium]|nr:2OG-Fe(II) oxygenase [Thiotrichales bacterium]